MLLQSTDRMMERHFPPALIRQHESMQSCGGADAVGIECGLTGRGRACGEGSVAGEAGAGAASGRDCRDGAGLHHSPVCGVGAFRQGGRPAVRGAAARWDAARQHGAQPDAAGGPGRRPAVSRRDLGPARGPGVGSRRGRAGRRPRARPAQESGPPLRGDRGQGDRCRRRPAPLCLRPRRPSARVRGIPAGGWPRRAWARRRPRRCCATATPGCGGCSARLCRM